ARSRARGPWWWGRGPRSPARAQPQLSLGGGELPVGRSGCPLGVLHLDGQGEVLVRGRRLLAHHVVGVQVDEHRRDVAVQGLEELRSEEHTSELQSREKLVCRLLLE